MNNNGNDVEKDSQIFKQVLEARGSKGSKDFLRFTHLAGGQFQGQSGFKVTNVGTSSVIGRLLSFIWGARRVQGRYSAVWNSLCLTQLVISLFYVSYLPPVVAVCAIILAIFDFHERVKFLLLVLIAVVFFTFPLFGVEFFISFLFISMMGKSLEINNKRDFYVLMHLLLLLLGCLFLLSQGLLVTFQVMVGTLLVLFTLIHANMNVETNLNDGGNLASVVNGHQQAIKPPLFSRYRLKTLGTLSVLALPLLVILFLSFPRLPPLWSVQLAGQQATTGVSDSMSPGDFANLSKSTELAFRVEFDQKRPALSQMYWRGLVFSDFDGVTWRPNAIFANRLLFNNNEQANAIISQFPQKLPSYRVILEKTGQQWLFALDYPMSQQRGVAVTDEFNLRSFHEINQRFNYTAQILPHSLKSDLSDDERRINLRLPKIGNEKAKQFANKLFRESGNDPVSYIKNIQQWITQGNFRYTLSPPILNQNRIDEFLFETQAGFCEHYASSFTFLMRAVGIPARVVAGYQGGKLGRDGQSWEVRQMDAHAWTEVWLDGRGWTRIDPTAFVAPERVEEGMDGLTEQQGASVFGEGATAQMSYQQYRIMQNLRRLSDQASYYWQKDVVGYDQDKQKNSFLKKLNIASLVQQLLVMFAIFALIFGLIVFVIWYRNRKVWHGVDLPFIQLSKRLQKYQKSLARQENEGVLAWLERLELEISHTNEQKVVHNVQKLYRQLRYGQLSQVDIGDKIYQEKQYQLKIMVQKLEKIVKNQEK